ncbi:hypothetical protein B566_EDAN017165 [Ephemera danica]|nr:hypothetical protein B566_EDAN017165 [Ephemera danica]
MLPNTGFLVADENIKRVRALNFLDSSFESEYVLYFFLQYSSNMCGGHSKFTKKSSDYDHNIVNSATPTFTFCFIEPSLCFFCVLIFIKVQ